MCVIFYCAGIYVACAFVMFGFDIIKVKCFSGVRLNGFYILVPSNILKFYGFVQIRMINRKQTWTFPGGQKF